MKIPLVLLSGLLSNARLWEHQELHLCDAAQIQTIASTQDTPEKMIGKILERAPERFALAGHSMGGWLCLEIIRAFPNRVSKLCLINTTAREDSAQKKDQRQSMIERVQRGEFIEVVSEIVEKFVVNPRVKQNVKEMFLEVGQEAFIHQEKAMLKRKESLSILPLIKCPTLVIHAAEDRNFSLEQHQELVAKIEDAKLAIVEDCGHMSPMEMPQAITSLLRFWLTYF